jgi:hypothetical protein
VCGGCFHACLGFIQQPCVVELISCIAAVPEGESLLLLICSKRKHELGRMTNPTCHSLLIVHGGAGEGKCTEIPQLHANDSAARTRASPAACEIAFPTAVSDGLLFVWMVPGADGLLQSSQYARSSPRACIVLGSLIRFFYKVLL